MDPLQVSSVVVVVGGVGPCALLSSIGCAAITATNGCSDDKSSDSDEDEDAEENDQHDHCALLTLGDMVHAQVWLRASASLGEAALSLVLVAHDAPAAVLLAADFRLTGVLGLVGASLEVAGALVSVEALNAHAFHDASELLSHALGAGLGDVWLLLLLDVDDLRLCGLHLLGLALDGNHLLLGLILFFGHFGND